MDPQHLPTSNAKIHPILIVTILIMTGCFLRNTRDLKVCTAMVTVKYAVEKLPICMIMAGKSQLF